MCLLCIHKNIALFINVILFLFLGRKHRHDSNGANVRYKISCKYMHTRIDRYYLEWQPLVLFECISSWDTTVRFSLTYHTWVIDLLISKHDGNEEPQLNSELQNRKGNMHAATTAKWAYSSVVSGHTSKRKQWKQDYKAHGNTVCKQVNNTEGTTTQKVTGWQSWTNRQ